ncbi:helix-turn-helix domain-containing protein [Streptomyces sp. NPDC015140]
MRINANEARLIRKVYRLTLEDMAALCDVSTSLIHKIENGQRNLSDRVQQRLVNEFELTPDKLARITAIYEETNIRGTKLGN